MKPNVTRHPRAPGRLRSAEKVTDLTHCGAHPAGGEPLADRRRLHDRRRACAKLIAKAAATLSGGTGLAARRSPSPSQGFGEGAPDVGGTPGRAGIAGKVVPGERGGNVLLRPAGCVGGDAEGHVCGCGTPRIARQAEELRQRKRAVGLSRPVCKPDVPDGSFLLDLHLPGQQLNIELLGGREWLAAVLMQQHERKEAACPGAAASCS